MIMTVIIVNLYLVYFPMYEVNAVKSINYTGSHRVSLNIEYYYYYYYCYKACYNHNH